MDLKETLISSRKIYGGKILELDVDEVRLPDGAVSSREVVRHCGGAAVLLVDGGKILLVKQFRYVYNKAIYEIPAGKINRGEEPLSAAMRELKEETGYIAELVPLLKMYPTPGYTDEVVNIFLAKNFTRSNSMPDEGEFLNVELVPITDVLNMIESGEVCDGKTVCAIYKYLYTTANRV